MLQLCFSMEVESSLAHPDKIVRLPGQPRVGFQQFSGYVTVDEKKHKVLFYYFVEAEIDPASKPLVLWLNGGPGCSSVGVGAFSENGPFRPNGEVLVRNDYSWNREANMLYLETPIGVGFSYSTNSSSYVAVDDETTARDNLVFLQRWYHKFPNYRQRDLFITGESYAGHYIPQLAKLMVELNKKQNLFNLKGIALGNPVLEFAIDFNSRAEYFWSHGLISDSTYRMFTSVCNYSRYVSEYYRDSVSPSCSRVMSQVSRETSKFVDKYDVTLDVCISSVLSQSMVLNPQQVSERVDVCVEDKIVNYLNRKDVQKALHALLVGVRRWAVSLQVGGWTQVYGNILAFATIRGASHEAPFSQPERSLMLFKSFLEGKPLPEVF
ncbi:Serine carboxypeptidase-like 45 isoform 2 [Theobroma cacao]|uniref:Carboxypeptidase n=1 Tax=Theobroma cacao TaxID=3641 RepID=A0A061G0A1_THECC|nr:Serine carboxypeptidase-like 45 isoform 2 [Theobroma cacao]